MIASLNTRMHASSHSWNVLSILVSLEAVVVALLLRHPIPTGAEPVAVPALV